MKKGIYLFAALIILSITFVSADIKINEFTVDPQSDWNDNGKIGNNDEVIELYNPDNADVDLTGWKISFIDTTSADHSLSGKLKGKKFLTILDPEGTQNNNGMIVLYDKRGDIVDSVTYGDWDDGNLNDNAVDGNAENTLNECLGRSPNGSDNGKDKEDFVKKQCSFSFSGVGDDDDDDHEQPPSTSDFITVNSPVDKLYDTRRVGFEIKLKESAENLYYRNHNDNENKWRRLCTDCSEFNSGRRKERFNEGTNEITIRAVMKDGKIHEKKMIVKVKERPQKLITIRPGNFKSHLIR